LLNILNIYKNNFTIFNALFDIIKEYKSTWEDEYFIYEYEHLKKYLSHPNVNKKKKIKFNK